MYRPGTALSYTHPSIFRPYTRTLLPLAFAGLLLLLTGCPEDQEEGGPSPTPSETPDVESPSLSLDPTTLSFGEVSVGEQATLEFTLANQGTALLVISDITLAGTGEGMFSLEAPALPLSIDPGGSQAVPVTFAPTTPGEYAETVAIVSNDEDHARSSLVLSGTGSEGTAGPDADQDGYTVEEGDCNDRNAAVYPGAPEGVDSDDDGQLEGDGLDNNCDGVVDEGTTAFDDDGDGYTELEGDCDDTNPAVSPGAEEVCGDTIDQDCDGEDVACPPPPGELLVEPCPVDFGTVEIGLLALEPVVLTNIGQGDLEILSVTVEGEGFDLEAPFEPAGLVASDHVTLNIAFVPPGEGAFTGTLTVGSDNPDAPFASCPLLAEAVIVLPDDDSDGYTSDVDCDDGDPTVHPGAPEGTDSNGDGILEGDGKDNNCNGVADEGTDAFDDDGDGYTELNGDCNDANAALNPTAPEGPDTNGDGILEGNGIDDDCDFGMPGGGIDEGTDVYDDDGDGYSELQGDCDDQDRTIYPDAPEGTPAGDGLDADGLDNDCDGLVDEGTLQVDDDGDGFAEVEGDCNDANSTVYPGALELGDGLDNDCDGEIDEDPDPIDDDGDGYSELQGDCNDKNPEIHPGATEGIDTDGDGIPEGNGIDDDCDGIVDDGTSAYDDDHDGYSELRGDCDDTDPAIHPNALEGADTNGDGVLEHDGKDNDCDDGLPGGGVDEGTDAWDDDGDGYTELEGDCNDRNAAVYPDAPEGRDLTGDGTPEGDGLDNDCDGSVDEGTSFYDDDGDGYTELQGDCDDAAPLTYPHAPEGFDSDGDGLLEGDGVDNNCNGTVDEGTDAYDDDRDGYTELEGDCNDHAATVHPGAEDVCDDGIDNDCQGGDLPCTQADHDGDGFTSDDGDCDDRNPAIHPDAPEGVDVTGDGIPDGNGVDDNCNGTVDEGTSAYDDDGDGYSEVRGDCNDADVSFNPGIPEGLDTNGDGTLEGDGLDNNCNGQVDEGTDAYDDDGDDYTELEGDCNDANEDIFPGADEANVFGLPNGIDDDCDGIVDEDFVVAGEILVAELMVAPTETGGQFVELYNTSEREIDLMGWTLETSAGAETISEGSSLLVQPGDVALLAVSDDSRTNGGLIPDAILPGLVLADEDTLQLSIPGTVVDTLSWDSSWPITGGASLLLDGDAQVDQQNDLAEYWCVARESYGAGDLGTPGEANGPCPEIDHDEDGYTVDDGDCDDFCDLIHPGAAEVIDTVDNNCDNVLAPGETPVEVALESAGFNDGDRAKIYVEGQPVGTNGYGYNLVTMDPLSGAVLDARNFDTWRTTTASTDMANYINGLPVNRIVLVAVRADGSANMVEAAYQALETLGSSLIRSVTVYDSFALVGRKGLSSGQAAERLVRRYYGTATAGSFRLATPVPLRVESAGYEDGNYVRFYVDGEQLSVSTYRGISIVVLDEYTGEVLDFATFDTHCCDSNASALAYYIRSLSPGQMVMAGIKDEGTNGMNEEAYTALESVGSGLIRQVDYRGAWALIGRKGSFPNNVIGEARAPKNTGAAVVEDQESCFR